MSFKMNSSFHLQLGTLWMTTSPSSCLFVIRRHLSSKSAGDKRKSVRVRPGCNSLEYTSLQVCKVCSAPVRVCFNSSALPTCRFHNPTHGVFKYQEPSTLFRNVYKVRVELKNTLEFSNPNPSVDFLEVVSISSRYTVFLPSLPDFRLSVGGASHHLRFNRSHRPTLSQSLRLPSILTLIRLRPHFPQGFMGRLSVTDTEPGVLGLRVPRMYFRGLS